MRTEYGDIELIKKMCEVILALADLSKYEEAEVISSELYKLCR